MCGFLAKHGTNPSIYGQRGLDFKSFGTDDDISNNRSRWVDVDEVTEEFPFPGNENDFVGKENIDEWTTTARPDGRGDEEVVVAAWIIKQYFTYCTSNSPHLRTEATPAQLDEDVESLAHYITMHRQGLRDRTKTPTDQGCSRTNVFSATQRDVFDQDYHGRQPSRKGKLRQISWRLAARTHGARQMRVIKDNLE